MKITSVTYRTNRPTSGSKYIHEHVELTATLAKGETPNQVLAKLRAKAQELLYPELTNLRANIAAASPLVARRLGNVSEERLSELYHHNSEEFCALLEGNLAPGEFIEHVLD